jgi:3-phosphoshikimate 1-carboxyvinyltransferase
MNSFAPTPLISRRAKALNGDIIPPGDKSISHRAIMFGGLAEGVTTVRGLLEGEDVLRTVAALRELGATIDKDNNGVWHIRGTGLSALRTPLATLDMGNSGTAARLLMGILAGYDFTIMMTGDASLQKRPMGRVTTPLTQMGASFTTTDGKMPLTIHGSSQLKTITYALPVASAQVKSAVLLAGLNAEGQTTVIESAPTRDHSENMLRHFGASVTVTKQADGTEAVTITGKPHLTGQNIIVPADISSAAFPMVAAILHPGSKLMLRNVGINPRRAGLIDSLREMGANIIITNQREQGGEPVADVIAEGSTLHGVTVPATRAPSMIDEYPILACAAACATGTTRLLGLGELRVKESDRLALIAEGLEFCGVKVEISGDDLTIHGTGTPPMGGATIATAMDHRIAMSFLVLGSATDEPVRIDDGSFIATSFPNFVGLMNGLGMSIGET